MVVENSRGGLLRVHALYAMLIGALLLASAPTSAAFKYLPHVPLACTVIAGGAALLTGVMRRSDAWMLAGLLAVFVFEISLATGIAAAYLAGTSTSMYAVAVYLHLGSVMTVHAVTIVRGRRVARGAA